MSSEGNASAESAHPSPSESTHPKTPPSVEFPNIVGHESGFVPPILSPYPSPSMSCHCVESSVNLSSPSDQPSPSLSGHPNVPFCQEVPDVFGQSSAKLPVGSSPNPSPSVSFH